MTTNELKHHVVDTLRAFRNEVWIANVGRRGYIRFGFPGLSDVIGFSTEGLFIAVECKNTDTGDKLTEEQNDFLLRVAHAGGIAGVATLRGDKIEWSWYGEQHPHSL